MNLPLLMRARKFAPRREEKYETTNNYLPKEYGYEKSYPHSLVGSNTQVTIIPRHVGTKIRTHIVWYAVGLSAELCQGPFLVLLPHT